MHSLQSVDVAAVQGLGSDRHLIIGQKGAAAPAAGHSRRLLDEAKSIWTLCQVCMMHACMCAQPLQACLLMWQRQQRPLHRSSIGD